MLVFVLAFILCCLYTSDTVIISYCYRFYAHNPSSTKLLLLSEALKLAIASCLHLVERKAHSGGADQLLGTLISSTDPQRGGSSCCKAAGQPGSHQHQQRTWSARAAWTLLVFSVPSLCYFASNNLSFYALTMMSAHLYTLLCDLKIVSTGLLNYFVLDKQLNQHAVSSLFGLFLGICISQYSTMRAAVGSLSALLSSHFTVTGFLLMILISIISATASVYTEWVMNYSQYRHESLNLQNMKLYSIGMLLNAAYYWQSGGQLEGFFSDVRGPHCAVVLVLALMGLITGVMIKHYGNIVKLYASSLATLCAALVSQVLLAQPPPALFYAGVCLALASTVQLQKSRSSQSGSADGSLHSRGSADGLKGGRLQGQHRMTASLVVPIALAILVLVFVPQMVPWSREWTAMQQGAVTQASGADAALQQPPTSLNNPASLVPSNMITNAAMPVLPPFEPTCLVRFEDHLRLGCRPMNCSLAESCSVGDKRCCAFYNHHMLDDVHRILHSKGLQGEYTMVYSTALGAAENQSILGNAPNVDLAFSPTALQVLAQNATRELLWRQGYVFWHDHDIWRLCPHDLHPDPDFRAAMLFNMTHEQWQMQHGSATTVHVNGYMMWRMPEGATSCAERFANPEAAVMLQPMQAASSVAASAAHSPLDSPGGLLQQQTDHSAVQPRLFCLQQSKSAFDIRAGDRRALVGGLSLPVPHNIEQHLATAYGAGWRTDRSLDRTLQQAPDWLPIQEALLTRLAVTAWGDMTWAERVSRCEAGRPKATAATAGEASAEAVSGGEEAEDAGDTDAVGMLQEQLLRQYDSDSIPVKLQGQEADLTKQEQWTTKQSKPMLRAVRNEALSVSQSSQQHWGLQSTRL